MSDFEKYIEAKYPNRSPKILFQKFKDIDGTLFYGVKEIEDQAEVWNHQQAIIEDLKAQLNNMEACYIQVKKERDELQGKSRCIKSLVEQRNLAENMLRKVSVAAQKKLPTFGAALRFNDEVKEILRGAND